MIGYDIFGNATHPGNEPNQLGIIIRPRPTEGFVRFKECRLDATKEYLEKALQPNTTTLLEIELQRNVDKNVFRLHKLDNDEMPSKRDGKFKNIKPGDEVVE